MTANELADELEDCEPYNIMDTHLFKAAATLLRQFGLAESIVKQQELRIAELEAENAELKAAVRSFFQDFLDIREESDSGRVFAPITISSCRCMMIEPLAEVLAKMRKLSGSEK